MNIKLEIDDVSGFVEAASRCDFDIDLNYDRVVIDAKSLLGVLSMDLGRTLTVQTHGEDPEFEGFLQRYVVG
jgi:phosphotransferase system HPr-like phosphotransfer protein